MRLLMGTPRPPVDPTKDPHARTDEDLKRVGSKLAHLAGTVLWCYLWFMVYGYVCGLSGLSGRFMAAAFRPTTPDPSPTNPYSPKTKFIPTPTNLPPHTHKTPGLAAFGARRKEKLEREIDALIEATVALGNSGAEGKDAEGAVKAVRTVGAYLTNLIKNFGVRFCGVGGFAFVGERDV